MCLIALNDQGYKNLCSLSNIVSKSKTVVTTLEDLKSLGEGVVAIVPSVNGPFINDLTLEDTYFNNYLYALRNIFSEVYLGMELDFDKNHLNRLRELASKNNLNRLYFHEVRCSEKKEQNSLRVLEAINKGIKLNEVDASFNNAFYLSMNDISTYFTKEEIDEVARLAVRCKVNLDNHNL